MLNRRRSGPCDPSFQGGAPAAQQQEGGGWQAAAADSGHLSRAQAAEQQQPGSPGMRAAGETKGIRWVNSPAGLSAWWWASKLHGARSCGDRLSLQAQCTLVIPVHPCKPKP